MWRNNEVGAESVILILNFSSFLSDKSSLKIWANDFSLLTFEIVKPFLEIIFNNWGKTIIRLFFLFACTIWRAKYGTKNMHFQSRISFSLFITFYSLSSCPLPARPLAFIVLHNGVKNIHLRKTWFVTWHRNAENSTNRRFQLSD